MCFCFDSFHAKSFQHRPTTPHHAYLCASEKLLPTECPIPKLMYEIPTNFIVADDDAINNMMCRFCIKRHFPDAVINTFEKPEAALEMISREYAVNEERRTMLFLDINMPTMTAWQFLDEFAKLDEAIQQQIAIHILSSSVDAADRQKAADHPLVRSYLSKPLTTIAMSRLFEELE
jgi:CheY-like chemotaxis protein